MANNSLLIATTSRSPAPQWTDDQADYQVLAEGAWRVPALWYALFRDEDLIAHSLEDENGELWHYKTPVVSRRRVRARLRSARQPLKKLPVEKRCSDFLLDGLAALIDRADERMRYVVCQWHEIADLDGQQFEKESNWMLRFFAGDQVQRAKHRFEAACGFPLIKLKNPQQYTASDYDDADWERLDRLLGDAADGNAPWHPASSKPKSLTAAIFHKDKRRAQEQLASGAQVGDADMLKAARQEDPAILQMLLENGGNPSATDRNGSCLVRAFNSRKAVEQKVELLLAYGADVNGHDPPYKVLVCCLRHGVELAPQIINRSKPAVLKAFKAWSRTESFDDYVATCDIQWADEFLALVNDR